MIRSAPSLERLGGAASGAAAAFLLVIAGCSGATAASPERLAVDTVPQEGPRTVQAGAPGEASRVLGADERVLPMLPHTEADVRFMQNMIHHHAQALEMASLVPGRTESRDILLLAGRIDRSQLDEIGLMARWLELRGEEVPDWRGHPGDHGTHAHHHDHHADADDHAHDEDHGHGGELMAGMLTPEQFERLAAAEGEEFDRIFLELMIFHHEGAIQMVSELFSMPGAGQDSEIFRFASHVEADQNIEIGRMERMLRERR